MEKVSFTKMSGAGNDFIVIDKDLIPGFAVSGSVVKNLCNRRNGIGADGLITIENSNEADFSMNYYNADGTQSLCGNGARCAIHFAGISGRVKNGKTAFLSNGMKYSGQILTEDKVKFFLNPPFDFNPELMLNAGGFQLKSSFINTGSPHVVINIDEIKEIQHGEEPAIEKITDVPVFNLGREIRNLKEFQPGGTNVNFIALAADKIYIRTYERGVEDETLACGTGSVASALAAHFIYNYSAPVTLRTFGGDDLIVDFLREGNEVKNLSLTGPVKVVYTGTFILNKFL